MPKKNLKHKEQHTCQALSALRGSGGRTGGSLCAVPASVAKRSGLAQAWRCAVGAWRAGRAGCTAGLT